MTAEVTAVAWALWGLSFIAAGVFYSASGYAKALRRALTGESPNLDYRKMGKSVILGVVLGIVAIVLSHAVEVEGPILADLSDTDPRKVLYAFIGLAGSHTAVILAADKWLLGRASPKTT